MSYEFPPPLTGSFRALLRGNRAQRGSADEEEREPLAPVSPGDVLLVVSPDWRDSSRIRDGEEPLLPGKRFHPSAQSVLHCKLGMR